MTHLYLSARLFPYRFSLHEYTAGAFSAHRSDCRISYPAAAAVQTQNHAPFVYASAPPFRHGKNARLSEKFHHPQTLHRKNYNGKNYVCPLYIRFLFHPDFFLLLFSYFITCQATAYEILYHTFSVCDMMMKYRCGRVNDTKLITLRQHTFQNRRKRLYRCLVSGSIMHQNHYLFFIPDFL